MAVYTSNARLDSLADTGYNGSTFFAGLIMDIANFGNRCVITLDDGTARLEVSCYAERFNRIKDKLKVDEVIVIKGGIRDRDGRLFARLDNAYTLLECRQRWVKKISIKIHSQNTLLLDSLQPLLKPAQSHLIPNHQSPAFDEDSDDGNSMEAYYNGNSDMTAAPVAQNDGCIPIALNIYTDFAIANVSLNDNWRLYPTDDNLIQLGTLVPQDNLYFHYQ